MYEIIRFACDQIVNNSDDTTKKALSMSPFFFSKLKSISQSKNDNFSDILNWTKKIDIFAYDLVIIPIIEKYFLIEFVA